MPKLDRILIFLGALLLTIIILYFFTYMNSKIFNIVLAGISLFSFLLTLFDFFRKKD